MKNLNILSIFFVIVFSATVCIAQTNRFLHIEPINGDIIPVSIDSPVLYKNYDSEGSFHTIDFSLTNKSEVYIGKVRFIGYELDEENEELSTRFWSEYIELRPYENKRLSTNEGKISSEAAKIVWVIHEICTEKGTWNIDLSNLRKAVFPYSSEKNIKIPKAEFNKNKCLPE